MAADRNAPRYVRTQTGTAIVVVLAVAAALLGALVAGAEAPGARLGLGIGAIALVLCLVVFATLRVEVGDGAVRAGFLGGRLGRRISLDRVESVRTLRIPWYYGFGLRLIPGGTMFAVSGLDAVELRLAGGRRFLIGTDDAEALRAAIETERGAG